MFIFICHSIVAVHPRGPAYMIWMFSQTFELQSEIIPDTGEHTPTTCTGAPICENEFRIPKAAAHLWEGCQRPPLFHISFIFCAYMLTLFSHIGAPGRVAGVCLPYCFRQRFKCPGKPPNHIFPCSLDLNDCTAFALRPGSWAVDAPP